MFAKLLLAFTLIPLVELALLIEIGRAIGAGPTLGIVILTGIGGAALAKSQGLAVLSRIRSELASGQIPSDSLLDGALVLAGGLLLVTPGTLTDLVGLLLLIPSTRRAARNWLTRYLRKKLRTAEIHTVSYWVDE
jgi:UPF0716 protein FxsA